MVDQLRKSVAELQAPECDNCRTEMRWYSAQRLMAAVSEIAHYFHCPDCGKVKQVNQKLRSANGGPGNGHNAGAKVIPLADPRAA